MSSTVYVCFLEADAELMEQHWLNKAAAYFSPEKNGKIHVELFFPESEQPENTEVVKGLACSIHYGGRVFLTQKHFSRKQWSFRTLSVSKKQKEDMLAFCREHVGDHFNHLSYFLSPWCEVGPEYPLMFGYGARWFCSELVVCGLRVGGVLDVSACGCSPHPQRLFRVLESASTPSSVRGSYVLNF